jgi:hypothetical protein
MTAGKKLKYSSVKISKIAKTRSGENTKIKAAKFIKAAVVVMNGG